MVEILGADNTDVNVGTLSGSLVLQRSLPLFKYRFPELAALWTDFSPEGGFLNQSEMTRIVTVPPVQSYDSSTDAAGRPKGWSTISNAQITDVPVVLNNYLGVPIVFSSQMLASTMRQLFNEQAPAAVFALAKQFMALITALMTPANFNSYASVNGILVPTAYATYAQAQKEFSMSDLDLLGAIFDANAVPLMVVASC